MTIAADLSQAQPKAELPPPPPLAAGAGISVFLDFDGTLVEIADRPGGVAVSPAMPQALAMLSRRLEGRLAIVSGRSLAALDQLLGPLGIAMAGSHGGEFRPAGAAAKALADRLPDAAAAALERLAGEHKDLVFEAKPCSAAIHYRLRPALGPLIAEQATRIAAAHGLLPKHGKMVIEVSMPGSDKGNAVARFMSMPPFAGTRPLFLGDDVTDEDAFAAVKRFDGAGILVGPTRPTQALWRLAGVAAVHQWLEDSA